MAPPPVLLFRAVFVFLLVGEDDGDTEVLTSAPLVHEVGDTETRVPLGSLSKAEEG